MRGDGWLLSVRASVGQRSEVRGHGGLGSQQLPTTSSSLSIKGDFLFLSDLYFQSTQSEVRCTLLSSKDNPASFAEVSRRF